MNGGVAPRAARRPAGKARRPRISGIFEGRATPPAGMHRGPNAGPIHEMGSSVLHMNSTTKVSRRSSAPVIGIPVRWKILGIVSLLGFLSYVFRNNLSVVLPALRTELEL